VFRRSKLHAPVRAWSVVSTEDDNGWRLREIYKGVVWYGKGMRNNGSHFVDLMRFLLGEASDPRLLCEGRAWNGTDPEPDVKARFGGADVHFLAAREECFTIASSN